jgi:O-antigen/teichoic acid export membrane protein
VIVVLGCLLSPTQFGLIFMILVTALASRIADLGLGAAIIQKKMLSDRTLDAAFWLSGMIGGALTTVFSLPWEPTTLPTG